MIDSGKRIPISNDDILKGNFDKDKEYVTVRSFSLSHSHIQSIDINLLINGIFSIYNFENLDYICENISLYGDGYVEIFNCPKLKTLPSKLIFGKTLFLSDNQHLTTILSEKQFDSLQSFENYHGKVKSYKEYYSFIKPTLEKQELLKVCL